MKSLPAAGASVPAVTDLSLADLEGLFQDLGEPAYRARQLWKHVWAGQTDVASMSDLPAGLRDRLPAVLRTVPLRPVTMVESQDRLTRKLLLQADDGTTLESVLMIYPGGRTPWYPDPGTAAFSSPARPRRTVCISSQAGCALGCTFCATAKLGLDRNLRPGEIVGQVLLAAQIARDAAATESGSRPITNVVFMGMGEPFANYDRVRQSIELLTDQSGFGLGTRHVTVSTAGLVPGIERFADEDWQVGLAISLHAPNDELRSHLMPINDRYPIAQLMAACDRYVEKTRRRITFEYILIAGKNDQPQHARQLASLLKGKLCHVNLIPMNPIGESDLKRTSGPAVRRFREIVARGGISCTVRQERGVEIYGACGQLRRYVPQPA